MKYKCKIIITERYFDPENKLEKNNVLGTWLGTQKNKAPVKWEL